MSETRLDNRWVGKKPLATRVVLYFILRPFLGFALNLLLAMSIALAPTGSSVPALYLLVFPWLLLIVFVLNLPFVGAAIRGFRLSEETRVNHALEHGTVYFLRRRYGKRFKIGGKAETNGFRLNGLPSDDLVVPAFNELRDHLARGVKRVVVSKRCGSMIVTAQGLAITLLTLAMVSFLVFNMTSRTKLGVLGMIVLLYLMLRHGLGWLLQRYIFVSVRFADATVRSVRRVKPIGPLERQQVYFVSTLVQKEPQVEGRLTTE